MKKQSIPLSYLLKENKKINPVTVQRKFVRQYMRETKKTIFKFAYPVLSNILVSGALTINESKALTFYLAYRTNYRNTIPVLNDALISKINEELKQPKLSQSLMSEVTRLCHSKSLIKEQRIVSEGLFSFIKDLYGAGKKGVAWLGNLISAGWNALKKVWGNFKELVSAAVGKLKEWLWTAGEKINAMVKSALAWCGTMWKSGVDALKSGDASAQIKSLQTKLQSKLGDGGISGTLSKEVETFGQNMDAIKTGVNKIFSGDAVAKAAANPPDEVGKEVDQLSESVNRHMQRKNYKKAFIAEAERSLREEEYRSITQLYKELFSDKTCVTTLREMKIPVSEGGGEAGHPEDIILKLVGDAPDESTKAKLVKTLHKVVHVAIKVLKWVYNPFVAAGLAIIKYAMANVFKGLNYIGGIKLFGGPGVGEAVGMGMIMSEIAEIVGHNVKSIHHKAEQGLDLIFKGLNIAFSFIPGIGTILKSMLSVCEFLGHVLFYYAIGVLIYNAVPMIKALIGILGGVAAKAADAVGDVAKATGA